MLAPRAGLFLGPVAAALLLDLAYLAVRPAGLLLPGAGIAAGLAGLLGFFLVFFRDPERPVGEGIVSAADGRVRSVERVGGQWRVSVFMNVTDVHVNRFPLDATVEATEPGGSGYRPAFEAEAEHNVQRRYRLSSGIGPVEVVQITGIVARRLVPFARVGATYRKGDRLGMIVLGSRVDVYLPADRATPTVRTGERVRAGASTIARLSP